MKILFICGREIGYTRNQVLLRAFRKFSEVETVVETNLAKSLLFRSARIGIRALPKLLSNQYDLVFVGFYGHLLMISAGLLSNRPILFDAFVSTYDTLTSDRLTYSPNSLIGKMAIFLDRLACHLASKVLVDTSAQEEYFSTILKVAKDKLSFLPVSCNEEIFYPRATQANNVKLVLSYSSYLPLHGMDTIVKAAEILKDEQIQFRLIGSGPLFQSVNNYAIKAGLNNVMFIPPMSLTRLSDEIATSEICLGGHFGLSEKAGRVIPGKIYQMMAMEKPIIAADTPANKELLQHGISAYFCQAGNPSSLAEAILALQDDPELSRKISIGARHMYEEKCSEAVVKEKLHKLVLEMISSN